MADTVFAACAAEIRTAECAERGLPLPPRHLTIVRGKRRREWTEHETECLRGAVGTFGHKWALILRTHAGVFEVCVPCAVRAASAAPNALRRRAARGLT